MKGEQRIFVTDRLIQMEIFLMAVSKRLKVSERRLMFIF